MGSSLVALAAAWKGRPRPAPHAAPLYTSPGGSARPPAALRGLPGRCKMRHPKKEDGNGERRAALLALLLGLPLGEEPLEAAPREVQLRLPRGGHHDPGRAGLGEPPCGPRRAGHDHRRPADLRRRAAARERGEGVGAPDETPVAGPAA